MATVGALVAVVALSAGAAASAGLELSYSTYLGGAERDDIMAVQGGPDGSITVAGYTKSDDLPTYKALQDEPPGPEDNGFVATFAPSGGLLYSTYLGGSGNETLYTVHVDDEGYVYVAGITESPDFPVTEDAFQTELAGAWDAFVAKLAPDGSEIVYATYLGGSDQDGVRNMDVDEEGNAYVSGRTFSEDFPTTAGAFQEEHQGRLDGFVAKVSPDGSQLEFATYVGGSGDESATGLAVDPAGSAYAAGQTDSQDLPTSQDALQPTIPSQERAAFVTKLTPEGDGLEYGTFLGGSQGSDGAVAVHADDEGHAFVTGETESGDFPTTSGAFQEELDGFMDAFVTKLAPGGDALAYSTLVGGEDTEKSWGISVDEAGRAWFAGQTFSAMFPVTEGAIQEDREGSTDAFVARLSESGDALGFASYLGGSGTEFARNVHATEEGVFVAGYTSSTDFPTEGARDDEINGERDAFVAWLGDPVAAVNEASLEAFGSVQSALNDASPSEAVLVHPGRYVASLEASTPGITVCPAARDGVACGVDPGAVTLVGDEDPAVTVSAEGVSLEAVTAVPPESGTGVRVLEGANGAVLERVRVVGESAAQGTTGVVVEKASGVSIQGGFVSGAQTGVILEGAEDATVEESTIEKTDEGPGHGIEARGGSVEIRENTLVATFENLEHVEDHADGFETVDQIAVRLSGGTAEVTGNRIQAWANMGILVATSAEAVTLVDNQVEQVRWHGVSLEGPQGGPAWVTGNVFTDSYRGVSLSGVDTEGLELRENRFEASLLEALRVSPAHQGDDVDARGNAWGVVTSEGIQARVQDEGEDNRVLVVPYEDENGQMHPPRPQVACWIEDAFVTVGTPVLLQQAVDLELPGACQARGEDPEPRKRILLGASHEAYDAATVNHTVTITTDPEPAGERVRASLEAAPGQPALAFEAGSTASRVDGLHVRVGEDATGLNLAQADAVTVHDVTLTGAGRGVHVDSADEAAVQESLFLGLATGLEATNATGLSFQDNALFTAPGLPLIGDEATGVILQQGGHHDVQRSLFQNVDEALSVQGSQHVTLDGLEARNADTGIRLDAHDGTQPHGFLANNTRIASALTPLVLTSETAHLDAEATCVDWGVYHGTLIEQRIHDAGTSNTVTYQPWTSLDQTDPGAACLAPPEAAFELDIEHGENSPEDTITRLDNITFVDDSDAGTREILEWRWDLGDGTAHNRSLTDPSQDVEHAYEDVATYPVLLTVEDLDGMTSRAILDVPVENLPPEVHDVAAPPFAQHGSYEARLHHSQALAPDQALEISADDPEQDALGFEAHRVDGNGTLTDLPGQAELAEREGYGEAELRFDPTPLQAELFEFEVNVTDAYEDSARQTLRVDVWNEAPLIDATPDLLAGAQGEPVTFTAHAYEPDPDELVPENVTVDIVPTNDTAPFPTPLDDVVTLTEHWEDEGVLIDFAWTPQNVDGEDSYEVHLTAEGPGRTTTDTIPLEVREDTFPPELTVIQAPDAAPEGTTVDIVVDATVHPDAVLDPVDWEATALSITETEDGNETGPVDDDLTTQANTVTWTATLPEDVDRVEVTLSADDGLGVVEITETVDVHLYPELSPHPPLETITDISTMQPIHGETLQLSADASDADGDLAHVDATVTPRDGHAPTATIPLSPAGPAWQATLAPTDPAYQAAFPTPGVYDVRYEALDDDGLTVLDEQPLTLQQLQAPLATTNDAEKFYQADGPLGADISLSATSTDPNQRILDPDDHRWYRTAGPDLDEGEEERVGTGPSVSTTARPGLHTYEIRVTDPYGETGTASTGVYVWGFITADATLDNADAQRAPDAYRYSGTGTLLKQIQGSVTVQNELQDGAGHANVLLEITYYGTEGNDDGLSYGKTYLDTDENGTLAFTFDQHLAGQLDSESIASMPGYHEITVDATWEDTREHVPNDHPTVPDTYEDSHTISFWVGPPGSQEAVEGLIG